MAKKLSQMMWWEVRREMSIAGSPEKITALGAVIETMIGKTIDPTNRAELTNAELMLRRILAEIKQQQRVYDKSY